MNSPFGWGTGRPATPSEVFVRSLPPGPLRAHLGNLHAMFLFSQSRQRPDPSGRITERQKADALAVFEHSLRAIAAATTEQSYHRRRPSTPGARREFKKKEK